MRNSDIRRIAFVGDYLPRKCGIATFTNDMYKSIAGHVPEVLSKVVFWQVRVRWRILLKGQIHNSAAQRWA